MCLWDIKWPYFPSKYSLKRTCENFLDIFRHWCVSNEQDNTKYALKMCEATETVIKELN